MERRGECRFKGHVIIVPGNEATITVFCACILLYNINNAQQKNKTLGMIDLDDWNFGPHGLLLEHMPADSTYRVSVDADSTYRVSVDADSTYRVSLD